MNSGISSSFVISEALDPDDLFIICSIFCSEFFPQITIFASELDRTEISSWLNVLIQKSQIDS